MEKPAGEAQVQQQQAEDGLDVDGYTEGGLALLRLLSLKEGSSSHGASVQNSLAQASMQMQRETSFRDMSTSLSGPEFQPRLFADGHGGQGRAVMSAIGSGRSPTATPPLAVPSSTPGPAEQAMQTGMNPLVPPLASSNSSNLWPSPFSIPAKLNNFHSSQQNADWKPSKPSLAPSFTAWFDNLGPPSSEAADLKLPPVRLGLPDKVKEELHPNSAVPSGLDRHNTPPAQPPLSPRSRDALMLKRQLQAEHFERLQHQQQAQQRLLYEQHMEEHQQQQFPLLGQPRPPPTMHPSLQGMWPPEQHHHNPSHAGPDPYHNGQELLRLLQGRRPSPSPPSAMNRFPHGPVPDPSREVRRMPEDFFAGMDHGQPMPPLRMLQGPQDRTSPHLLHGGGGSPSRINLHNRMPKDVDLPPGVDENGEFMGRIWGPGPVGPPNPNSPRGPFGCPSPPHPNGPVRSPRARGYPPGSPRGGGFAPSGSPRAAPFHASGSPQGPAFRGPHDFFGEPPMPPAYMSPPPFAGARGGPMPRPPFDPSFTFPPNPEPLSPHAAPYGPNFHPEEFFPDSMDFPEGPGGGMRHGWADNGARGGGVMYGPIRPGGERGPMAVPHRSPQRSPHRSPHRSPVGTPPGRGMGMLHDANFQAMAAFDMRDEEGRMFEPGDILGSDVGRYGRDGRQGMVIDGGRVGGRRAGRGEGGRRGARTGGAWPGIGKDEGLREEDYGGPYGQRGTADWEGSRFEIVEGLDRGGGFLRSEDAVHGRNWGEEQGHGRGRDGRPISGRGKREDGKGREDWALKGEEAELMKGRSYDSREEPRRRKNTVQEWRLKQPSDQGQMQDGTGLEGEIQRAENSSGSERHVENGVGGHFSHAGAAPGVVPLVAQLDHPGLPSAMVAVTDGERGDAILEAKRQTSEANARNESGDHAVQRDATDEDSETDMRKRADQLGDGGIVHIENGGGNSGERNRNGRMEGGNASNTDPEVKVESELEKGQDQIEGEAEGASLRGGWNQLSFRELVDDTSAEAADAKLETEELPKTQLQLSSGTSSIENQSSGSIGSTVEGFGTDGVRGQQLYPELPDALDMAVEMQQAIDQHDVGGEQVDLGQGTSTVGRNQQLQGAEQNYRNRQGRQREEGNRPLPLSHPSSALQPRQEGRYRLDMMQITARLLATFESLIPTPQEEFRRRTFLQRLDNILARNWADAKLFLYGSCANAFGVRNSDIDVCLAVDDSNASKPELISRMAAILNAEGMRQVQALTHARVPIVKFVDSETEVACDICVNNMLAVANTKLLRDYAQVDERLRQLAFLVKHWAKRRQVNETYRGTLSSYAYVMMCIHYLQQRRPPILPCLQSMEPTYRVRIGDIVCAYFDRVETLRDFGASNHETVGEILTGFFEYWGFRHDYNRSVVSVRTGGYISKDQKDWTRRIGNERHLLCIEDPFEISHDLGRVVDRHSMRFLRDEFQRAARVMRHDPDPCTTLFNPYVPEDNDY